MAGVLELAQLVEDDGMTQVDVGRRRVDPEFDTKRTALALGERQLLFERALGKHVDGADHEVVDEPLVGHAPSSFVGVRSRRG